MAGRRLNGVEYHNERKEKTERSHSSLWREACTQTVVIMAPSISANLPRLLSENKI